MERRARAECSRRSVEEVILGERRDECSVRAGGESREQSDRIGVGLGAEARGHGRAVEAIEEPRRSADEPEGCSRDSGGEAGIFAAAGGEDEAAAAVDPDSAVGDDEV